MNRFSVHQIETVQTGLNHPECVAFGPDGRLYAGGFAGEVYVMDPPQFEPRVLANIQGVSEGVIVDGNHNVYVCNATKRSVQRVSQQGAIKIYCDKVQDGPLILPNYGLFDSKGNYYFSDSGDSWKPNGRLIRVKPNGQSESLMGGNSHFANGLAISPENDAIFMIESTAADLLRIPLKKDGTVGAPEIYVQFQDIVPNALAFARSGNLYLSCYYPNHIYLIDPNRNVELLIEDTTGELLNQPTNIAFEPNGTRLFVGNFGGQHIGALDVGERGIPMHYPKL